MYISFSQNAVSTVFIILTKFSSHCRELDPGIEEAVATLIWSAPRLWADVQELKVVSSGFVKKFYSTFVDLEQFDDQHCEVSLCRLTP